MIIPGFGEANPAPEARGTNWLVPQVTEFSGPQQQNVRVLLSWPQLVKTHLCFAMDVFPSLRHCEASKDNPVTKHWFYGSFSTSSNWNKDKGRTGYLRDKEKKASFSCPRLLIHADTWDIISSGHYRNLCHLMKGHRVSDRGHQFLLTILVSLLKI